MALELVSYSDDIKTMTSREIAGLTGKRHDNVLSDCRKMFEELEIDALTFQVIYLDSMSREKPEYALPFRECQILMAGYNTKHRAAIVDRWLELEKPRSVMTRIELAEEQVRLIRALDEAEKEAARLSVELDYAHEWATIKRMEKLTGKNYCWRKLKAGSIEIDCPRKDIFDANYGTVKSYHRDLWAHCYDIDIAVILKDENLPALTGE